MSVHAGFDVYKDIPGYKAILKVVLKNVIQILVEQLSEQTGEESVVLTASINDGTLSHLGSQSGRHFLEGHDEIKSQFLGFCLKRHHKRKSHEALQVPQPKRFATATHPLPNFSPLPSDNDLYLTSQSSPSFDSPGVHPISLTKVKRKQQTPAHISKFTSESTVSGSDAEGFNYSLDTLHEAGLNKSLNNRHETQRLLVDRGSKRDSIPVKTSPRDSDIAKERPVIIKTEDTNDGASLNNEMEKDVEEKSVEHTEEILNTSAEDSFGENSAASVKIENLDENDLEITGVEGEQNEMSGSVGAVTAGFGDGQMYVQGISGLKGQGHRTDTEEPFNGLQHPVAWLDEAGTIFQDPVTQIFGCGICKYRSPSKTNVKRHTRRHTCNQNQRPVCEFCLTSFIDKYKLKKHIEANHMGIRYICKKCGRQFKTQYYLAVHKKCLPIENTGSESRDEMDNYTSSNSAEFGDQFVTIDNVSADRIEENTVESLSENDQDNTTSVLATGI